MSVIGKTFNRAEEFITVTDDLGVHGVMGYISYDYSDSFWLNTTQLSKITREDFASFRYLFEGGITRQKLEDIKLIDVAKNIFLGHIKLNSSHFIDTRQQVLISDELLKQGYQVEYIGGDQ